jgi:hypothetical protein
VPLQLLRLVSARRDVASLIQGSISRAPPVMSEVAHQVRGRWTRESINRGPRETVGRGDVDVKVVKKGDQVAVTYTEALALSVAPAPKRSASKK